MSDTRSNLRVIVDQVMYDLLPRDNHFAILDFPNHDNVGDSAIYVGEMDYLQNKGLTPSFVATRDSSRWSDMDRVVRDGPILLHGGGNLGDLWQPFQKSREQVLERWPGRPVIQLPQSIYFQSDQNADRFARIVERHGAFTLLVRDQPSLAFAQQKLQCEVRLCPDMAFAMRSIHRYPATKDLLLHLRTDQEAARTYDTTQLEATGQAVRLDWTTDTKQIRRSLFRRTRRRAAIEGLITLNFSKHALHVRRYQREAEIRLEQGIRLLSTGKVVITDRLHGHILCLLLDIPHIVLDNSYGKVSNFMEAWGTKGPKSSLTSSFDEAVSLAEMHVSQPGRST